VAPVAANRRRDGDDARMPRYDSSMRTAAFEQVGCPAHAAAVKGTPCPGEQKACNARVKYWRGWRWAQRNWWPRRQR